jgi:CO/xanthine dehydrogenase FAD-binding subunit
VLEHGELITGLDLPLLPFATHSHYRKVRDRASYAFALVSIAAAIDMADGSPALLVLLARLAKRLKNTPYSFFKGKSLWYTS